jgi:hypothetical protein
MSRDTTGTPGENRKGPATGSDRARGVRSRSAKTGLWTKLDTSAGRFIELRKTGAAFKGVKRER